jgi:hypothetical protein
LVNDIGCNVGHFYRLIPELELNLNYVGYDIDSTYLGIAGSAFPSAKFQRLDISCEQPRNADITVISATLEHIAAYRLALDNILYSTSRLILLRTFIGDTPLEEYCQKSGASVPYLIRQFSMSQLCAHFSPDWTIKTEHDLATLSKPIHVCNRSSILRKQCILVISKT